MTPWISQSVRADLGEVAPTGVIAAAPVGPPRTKRSVARKICRRDETGAGQDNPSAASELDALDAPRSGQEIPLADFALSIASANKGDVIASVEHDVAAQKRLRAFD